MTLQFFLDLTITVFGYAILAVSYLGMGWACSLVLKIDLPLKEKPFLLIWLGWAVALLLIQILNLFIPIAITASLSLLILGTIFAVIFFKMEFKDKKFPSLLRVFPALVVIAALCIAILSMSSPTIFDDGLYHFNSIRWLNEYPIVLESVLKLVG